MAQLSSRDLDLLQVLEAAQMGAGELSTYPGYMDPRAEELLATSYSALGSWIKPAGVAKLRELRQPGWAWFKAPNGAWEFGSESAQMLAKAQSYDDEHIQRARQARQAPAQVKATSMTPEARELTLHAENNEHLWNRRRPDFLKNAIRRKINGTYDSEKGLKLWEYFADEAARSYTDEHGGRSADGRSTAFGAFNKSMRREAARYFRNQFEDAWDSGELRTYQPELFPKGATVARKKAKKKSTRKKPRTAAQKRATKKLIAANKKKAKKRTKKKRTKKKAKKRTKKKATKRRTKKRAKKKTTRSAPAKRVYVI